MKVCIVGASGKLGPLHGSARAGPRLRGGRRLPRAAASASSTPSRAASPSFRARPNDREVIERAVEGCDGVLTVLVPWGVQQYSTGTAQAVLDHARAGRASGVLLRLAHHARRQGRLLVAAARRWWRSFGPVARLVRFADLDDQVEACRRIFASDTRWTVVRGSDLEEGESQGLPVWSRHVGDPDPREQHDPPRRLRACSWWRRSRTTRWCTRRRRSSAAAPLRPSPTPRPSPRSACQQRRSPCHTGWPAPIPGSRC